MTDLQFVIDIAIHPHPILRKTNHLQYALNKRAQKSYGFDPPQLIHAISLRVDECKKKD